MALIKYSPIVNELRGSVGNATFQKSQGGAAIRKKPSPTVRDSQYTSNVRSSMSAITFVWRNLTDAQKKQWFNFLSFSPDFQKRSPKLALTPYSLFLKYNSFRVLHGLSILAEISYLQALQPSYTALLLLTGGNLYFGFEEEFDTTNWFVQLRTSRAAGNQTTKVLNDLRITPYDISSGFLLDLTPYYPSVWGALPVVYNYLNIEFRFVHLHMPFAFAANRKIYQVKS